MKPRQNWFARRPSAVLIAAGGIAVALLAAGLADALRRDREPLNYAAAQEGDPKAQFELGLALARGVRMERDDVRSAHWLRKAAEQGYGPAQNQLGLMYENGRGVAPSDAMAVYWYREARKSGEARGAENLDFGRSEMLLASLLPASVAARLKERPAGVIADHLPAVTVLFADIVGFTDRAAHRPPRDVVDFLGRVFAAFDELAEKHGMEKIKTIGDSYMAVGGIAGEGGSAHAVATAEMALDMMEACDRLTAEGGETVRLRIGMSSGPAVGGVIGRQKPFFDVWGDTINMAARMESTGLPGRIQATSSVPEILGDRYLFEERGRIHVKGRGSLTVHFLVGRAPDRNHEVPVSSGRWST